LNPRFDSLDPKRGPRSFHFSGPIDTIVARRVDEVVPALARVEAAVGEGRHAAGFIAYEAAPAFDSALVVREPQEDLPLLYFGIYRTREEAAALAGLPSAGGSRGLGPLTPSLDAGEYQRNVEEVLELIGAGDTYQVNFTFRLRGSFEGDPLALYRDLCGAQRSAYCAFLDVGSRLLISASPELFFHRRGETAELRPMKGTRRRGRWSEEDASLAAELNASAKDRAENLMIVDLLRNDLGRVAEFGSVRVPSLFDIERYPTVHQLTSTVVGELRDNVGLPELFGALFPSGSVTGAPKIRTSQIIRELEDSPRGAYTGAIGFVSPDEAIFSVAIRTLVLDPRTGEVEVGVGSGITADSIAAMEYAECLEKGSFLRRLPQNFELLESLRLEVPGGYPLLAEHLARLAASAEYFDFAHNPEEVRAALARATVALAPGLYKARLLVARHGTPRVETEPIDMDSPSVRLKLAASPVAESDPFLFHKTTRRETYQRALSERPGCDDVILFNQRGEITETTTSNLVLEIDGILLTPPIESGILPGVFRGGLLEEGRIEVRALGISDLQRASKIHLVNSVRGWREGIMVE